MTTRIHMTVSGHRIEYEATPKVAAFLRRLEELVSDPKTTEQAMIGLAYSHENPILDSTVHPARGVVTKAVLDDPAYAVVTDLLFRKRLVQDDLDIDKIAAKSSMTVPQAAAELGIHESAVRQAIAAKRLPSWMKDGRHYVEPRALKTLDVGTRGPTKKAAAARVAEPLEVRMGSSMGANFNVRAPHAILIEEQDQHVQRGTISRWKRVVVRSTAEDGSARAWVIEPGPDVNEIVFSDFYVRGRFQIATKENNPKRATELWKATKAE